MIDRSLRALNNGGLMNQSIIRGIFRAAILSMAIVYLGHSQFKAPVAWPVPGQEGGSQGHWIGDFNGDGRADVLKKISGSWRVALSKGNGFDRETEWAASILSDADRWFVGDFNGDGQCDIAGFYAASGDWEIASAEQSRTDGSGTYHFTTPVKWTIPQSAGSRGQWIGDFNGDGLSDVLFLKDDRWYVALSHGNGFDGAKQWGASLLSDADQWYVGDFNGDGLCDLAGYSGSTGSLTIALANPAVSSFMQPRVGNSVNGLHGTNEIWIRDCDADGKADVISSFPNGSWRVAKSGSNAFGKAAGWGSAIFKAAKGTAVFAGDFNGDGYCDLAQFDSTGGTWLVSLNDSPKSRTVAVWYTMWYTKSDTADRGNLWNHTKRDRAKIPIASEGVGTDTVSGIYDSFDKRIIRHHIDAMRKNGITLIIVDFTNGYNPTADKNIDRIRSATDSLFKVMSQIEPAANRIKIVIALGIEFWGPRQSGDSAFWANGGWPAKTVQEKTALDRIQHDYVDRYGDLYFRYGGKPLIPVYIGDGTDNPPRNRDGSAYPLWHDNRFTIKNLVGWTGTWSYIQGGGAHYFHNGLDNDYNGWSWGSLYGGTSGLDHPLPDIPTFDRIPPLPFSAECMSIMPGTHDWWDIRVTWNVPRSRRNDNKNSGDYYIKSWTEVIRNMPVIVMIADWNNWNEETAIEPSRAWKDYYGNVQPDWYLQITKAYSAIFRSGRIPDGTFVREEDRPTVYKFTVPNHWVAQSEKPEHRPVIVLPSGWADKHYPRRSITK
jgi:hypothetical protein